MHLNPTVFYNVLGCVYIMFKSQELVIKELKELFDIDNNREKGSYETNGKFGVSKKHMERFEVLDKLRSYFNGVGVEGGYLSVDPMTFVHTTFQVCNGTPS